MAKKEKTMKGMLAKIDLDRIKRVGGSEDDLNKVRALHKALLDGKTWEDEEVRQLFGVLPDCFAFGACFVSNEILVRIGKARPIKVVPRPGDSNSRTRWVPIDKAEELGISVMAPPLHGYEVQCSGGCGTFYSREIWHIGYCESCRSLQKKSRSKPTIEPEPVKPAIAKPVVGLSTKTDKPKRRGRPPKTEKIVPTDKPKPKRRGRPPKNKSEKKPSKRSKKSEKTSVRPTKTRKVTRKRKK